jgi:acetylornithine deacetylase/succinyl-diaminopimelate desuccinylase-like protein
MTNSNQTNSNQKTVDRRAFLAGAAAALMSSNEAQAQSSPDLKPIFAEIEKRHSEYVNLIQTWVRQPTIAAESNGMNEGCDLMMKLLRDAGCDQVTKCPTDLRPGVFATLDAGAAKTLAVYFMYDVKQVDPSEWSSPPFKAALVDKPGLGTVLLGRGAVNP